MQMLEIWQTIAKCTIINSGKDLTPALNQNAKTDFLNLDLTHIKVDNSSYKRLFEFEDPLYEVGMYNFTYKNGTTDEKMTLVDNMLYCAIIITDSHQVRIFNSFLPLTFFKVLDVMKFFGYMKNRIVIAITKSSEIELNMTANSFGRHPYERAADEPFLILSEETKQLRLHCPEAKKSIPLDSRKEIIQKLFHLQLRLR